jgi:membrane protein CcdC involved in cytochrome C biogenesis
MQLMLAASAVGMSAVIAWRVRETRRPLTRAGIIMPPVGMSTGFGMFLVEPFRMPWWWGLTAFALGYLVFAVPLIKTSRIERSLDHVVLRGSPAFLITIGVLALIRFLLRDYLETVITPLQTASVFFVLAFGMILRWRLDMLQRFVELKTK